MPPWFSERFSNGFTTVIAPMAGRHQVLINLLVRVGSRYERAAESGISHFLEHMLFRGNAAHPSAAALNRVFERVGSIPNAHTGEESTEFFFVSHPELMGPALEALASLVQSPTFPDLEKEQGIVLDEINYDYNERGELVHMGSLAAALLWPGHPLGQSIVGQPETVARFTAESLRAHHQRHYHPRNMVLGLAGDLAPEQGIELARRAFGRWADSVEEDGAGAPPNAEQSRAEPWRANGPDPGPRTRLVEESDNQFHLQLSFRAPGYNDPDEIPMVLLNRILDDGPATRLQQALREEQGLVYHVAADYTGFREVGQVDVMTTVKPERLSDVLQALTDCILSFREEGPREEELALARQRHRFDLDFSRDSLQAQLDRFAWPLLDSSVREAEEEWRLVEAVEAPAIHRLARQVFTRSRLCLVLVGPLDAATEGLVERTLARF